MIGFFMSWLIVSIIPSFNLEEYIGTPVVSIKVAAIAIGLLFLVGIFSGLPPARRAASLQPVQALKP